LPDLLIFLLLIYNQKLSSMSTNVIPLNEAILAAASWRALAEAKLGPSDFIKAFTIPMDDFTQILAEGAVEIRAYIGNSPNNDKKLLFVGVDENGEDMIDYANNQFVYDFTTPCPPTCNPGSPLD